MSRVNFFTKTEFGRDDSSLRSSFFLKEQETPGYYSSAFLFFKPLQTAGETGNPNAVPGSTQEKSPYRGEGMRSAILKEIAALKPAFWDLDALTPAMMEFLVVPTKNRATFL